MMDLKEMKMKMTHYITAVLLLGLTACNGFLDEVDQDKMIPTTTDHYAAFLLQEFSGQQAIWHEAHYMTDEIGEVKSVPNSSGRVSIKPVYTWQRNIELTEEGKTVNNNTAWGACYQDIAIANYVLEQASEAEGTTAEINFLKGEAYFIRAYSYFNLVNLYAAPYVSAEQAKVTLGIPIRTDIGVLPTYDRKMLSEVYIQLESDLAEARTLMEESKLSKSIFHPTVVACDLLLSRVKLYKKEYDGTIAAATNVVASASLYGMTAATVGTAFIDRENPELLYSFGTASTSLVTDKMQSLGFAVEQKLIDSYDEADFRKSCFFTKVTTEAMGTYYYPAKFSTAFTALGMCNFRVAEAYLNRAEAYACLGKIEEAREDIQMLLEKRYKKGTTFQIPDEKKALLAFIRQERMKELCFEEHHRWFDLRRIDVSERTEIVHIYTLMDAEGNKQGTEYFHLLPDDKNYTLSLPQNEKTNNPLIFDYERYDKLPEYNEEIII